MSTSRIEILTTGDELLRGELQDTNSAWLASRLYHQGLALQGTSTVGDELAAITAALAGVVRRAGAVLVSGGLGPTDDDRTSEAVAKVAGVPLELDEGALQTIRDRFASIGLELTPNNEKQAWVPRGAQIIDNPVGTAPGFAVEIDGCVVCCLPGVPRELKRMFDATVAPMLGERLGGRPAALARYKLFGLAEAQVDHHLKGLLEAVDLGGCEVTVHYRATFPEIHVTHVVRPPAGLEVASPEVQQVIESLGEQMQARVGRNIFTVGEASFADAMVAALREAGATLSLAESCTGGLAGDLITSAAGSSDVFRLSAVTYHNDAKHQVLGVPREVLETDGAVSRACVEAMARGARRIGGSTYGASISGIAGPGGGTPTKPVGTVHFAVAGPDGPCRHLHRVFAGYDRPRIKRLSAYIAHWLVYRELRAEEGRASDGEAEQEPLGGRFRPVTSGGGVQ